ncbi:MAG TPA: Hsp20/alpha crystallin family protein [Blastocatellia bacterium]|nr:Hsp20/alpha crystallin family protein [Blastocatellia bacterium]
MTAPLSPLPQEFSERLRDQLRRLLLHFEEMRSAAPPTPGSWLPPVDLYEMDDAAVVRLEVPGVPASSIRVTILDGVLKIEGTKETASPPPQSAEQDKPLRYLCLERTAGTFSRRVQVKWTIDLAHVTAKLANGILEVRLPKAQASGKELLIAINEE